MNKKKSSAAKDTQAQQANEQANESLNQATAQNAAKEPPASPEEAREAEPLSDFARLQQDFAALAAAKEAGDNQMLRLQADFDNFRKRTRAEKEEWRSMIIAGFVADLLPVLDNFRWALLAMEKDAAAASHLAGVQMILSQLQGLLAEKGVSPIKALNEPFDPKLHEALGQIEVTDEAKIGRVLEEITVGYQIGEKILRPSRVRIGAAKQEQNEAENQAAE